MYILIASAVLFAFIAHHHERLHPAALAAFAVLPIYLLNVIVFWIPYGLDSTIDMYASPLQLATLALQYLVALFVFHSITRDADSTSDYLGWVAVGWPLIFLCAPWLAGVVL